MAKQEQAELPEVVPSAGAVPYYWVEGCKPNTPVRILERSARYRQLLEWEASGELEEKMKHVRKKGPWTASVFVDETVLKESLVATSDPEGNVMKRDPEVAMQALKNAREFNPRARLHPLGMQISDERLIAFGIAVKKV